MRYRVVIYLLEWICTCHGAVVRRWKKWGTRHFETKKKAVDYINYMATRPERKLALQKLTKKDVKLGGLAYGKR